MCSFNRAFQNKNGVRTDAEISQNSTQKSALVQRRTELRDDALRARGILPEPWLLQQTG
jgi:hypothetical protein